MLRKRKNPAQRTGFTLSASSISALLALWVLAEVSLLRRFLLPPHRPILLRRTRRRLLRRAPLPHLHRWPSRLLPTLRLRLPRRLRPPIRRRLLPPIARIRRPGRSPRLSLHL